MNLSRFLLLALLPAGLALQSADAQDTATIGTTQYGTNTTRSIQSNGITEFNVWGETFTTPITSTTESITTPINAVAAGDTITAMIYSWNPTNDFASPQQGSSTSITTTGSGTAYYTFNFTTPLAAGSDDVFLFTSTNNDTLNFGNPSYAGGGLVGGTMPFQLSNYTGNFNLDFSATFTDAAVGGGSSVPDSSNLVFDGLIFCAVLAVWRHRQALRVA